VSLRRTHEISRLEAFSDAAFAFALTLLVVSLEVPRSYRQLVTLMQGFPSFACCFALLVWIWYEHNLFFRRYGLQDPLTVLINSALLFVALFYIYPLKFMFDSMFAQMLPASAPGLQRMTFAELATASEIYGFGFFALLMLFAALYCRAYAKRGELQLDPLEVFDVQRFAAHHVLSALVGLVVVLIAAIAPPPFTPLAPAAFALMGPALWLAGTIGERKRSALQERLAAAPSSEAV
jgi:uncharacterized membrane protein